MGDFGNMTAAAVAQALLSGQAAVERVDRSEIPPPIFSVDLLERLEQEYPERAPNKDEDMLDYNRHIGKRELIKTIREWSVKHNDG